MKSGPISILLAEDHVIVLEGLRTLLEAAGEFKVVGEASTGRDAVNLALTLHPDIIVMDVSMPVLNGIEATRQIRLKIPGARILALSAYSDDEYVEHLIEAGASGYVIKQSSGQVLVAAIRAIMKGGTYFSASIAARLEHQERQAHLHGKRGSARRPLTSREIEVLQMVAEGFANKQIAQELGISIKTVEKHRQQLMNKLNIHETAGLTRHAIREKIIKNGIGETGGGASSE